MGNFNETTYFPRQKLSIREKNKKWRKSHADWADNNSNYKNTKIRKSYRNKLINYDLVAGIVHSSDIKQLLNPYNKQTAYIPNSIQHYPIVNNVIDLLVGEEANRKIKLTAKVKNEDAVSTLEENRILEARRQIIQLLQQENKNPQQLQEASQNIQKYINYNLQDLEELNDNYILQHYMREVDFDSKLLQGFKDVNISNEEIYYFDIVSGEPIMERIHPKKVDVFRTSQSSRIEDADIIVIKDYWSPGKILDRYYEQLTEKDQKYIEDFVRDEGSQLDENDPSGYVDFSDVAYDIDTTLTEAKTLEGKDTFLYHEGSRMGDYKDSDNNIRVIRIIWKSKKKLLKVKSYDPQTGEPLESWRSETYEIKKELGEEATVHWVNEWWEATKIAKEIYVNMRPKLHQFRRMSNVSLCSSGLVGQIYSSGEARGYCMLDKMKPYQYLFDIIHDRYLKLLSNHIGKVLEIDTAKVPEGWEPDMYLNILRTENIMFTDSFRESNKGQMIGAMNNGSGKSLDLDLSSSLQLYTDMLSYINSKMYEMVGITPQRLGEIKASETVGGVERSVERSSSITAELFSIHDDVKKRCAETLLEVSKVALKGNKKKLQFVTDDNITQILDINGDDFSSRDHGIFIENEMELGGLRDKLNQLAHAWSQNETVSPSTMLKIISDPSLSSIQRRIEKDITDKQQRDIQSQERDAQTQKEIAEQANRVRELQIQLEQEKIAVDRYRIDVERQTKLDVEAMKQSIESGDALDRKKLDAQINKTNKDFELKNKQISETIRHNKATESISKNGKS